MAYDSGRRVTVLFGGDASAPLADTWEWDGNNWIQRFVSGPTARLNHAMAYDSARGVTVLFGGYDGKEDGETWEWDGNTWTLRATTGPSPRIMHAMAYDSARGVTVLFGGGSGGNGLQDTWEWDGSTWTPGATTGPSKRVFHAMSYDSARGVTVLFGGGRYRNYFVTSLGGTWDWDGDQRAWWTNYGSGWPGTIGIPTFAATGDPLLCSTITLDLGNSRGTNTVAALFLGLAPTDQPTDYDGHVLVVPSSIHLLTLPSAGLSLSGGLPCDGFFCGASIYLQALEIDPGASQGVSFTRGLRLVVGS
jgi:hypothetical protein